MSYLFETCTAAFLVTAAAAAYTSDVVARMPAPKAGHHAAAAASDQEKTPCLRIDVHPTIATAPATVRIRASVGQAAENRQLQVVADSDEYLRSSTIALEGAEAPRFHVVEFRAMPPGEYDVMAVVTDAGGRVRGLQRQKLIVLP